MQRPRTAFRARSAGLGSPLAGSLSRIGPIGPAGLSISCGPGNDPGCVFTATSRIGIAELSSLPRWANRFDCFPVARWSGFAQRRRIPKRGQLEVVGSISTPNRQSISMQTFLIQEKTAGLAAICDYYFHTLGLPTESLSRLPADPKSPVFASLSTRTPARVALFQPAGREALGSSIVSR
jgi:hypothetical protein